MSVISKLCPMGTGICWVEITITPDQLRQESKDFIAHLIAAGITPQGLHFEDFIPVVLRRRMENLILDAKRLGFRHGRPIMLRDYDAPQEEGPGFMFAFATETEAVAFKIALL